MMIKYESTNAADTYKADDDDDGEYDAEKLEEILHQDLINLFKPKYNFDDDDDEDIYLNRNNEKAKLKNALDHLIKSVIFILRFEISLN